MISIIDFEEKYFEDFKRLNLAWLDHYHLKEQADLDMIEDARNLMKDGRGYVFLAQKDEEIVGTVALIRETPEQYELVKMAVAPAFQGLGISRLLMEKCMSTAKANGARRIYLQSNNQLTIAIRLYEKFGFRHIPVKDAHYASADVMMEILL